MAVLYQKKPRHDAAKAVSRKFRYTSDKPFKYDVQKRVPAVEKAAKMLGFRAETTLDQILDEVMPWIVEQIRIGGI